MIVASRRGIGDMLTVLCNTANATGSNTAGSIV